MRRALDPQATRESRVEDPRAVATRTSRAGRSPLGAMETFILSKIDGRRTLADLAALVGLSSAEVGSVIGRLVELEIVALAQPLEPLADAPASEDDDDRIIVILDADLESARPPPPTPRGR